MVRKSVCPKEARAQKGWFRCAVVRLSRPRDRFPSYWATTRDLISAFQRSGRKTKKPWPAVVRWHFASSERVRMSAVP